MHKIYGRAPWIVDVPAYQQALATLRETQGPPGSEKAAEALEATIETIIAARICTSLAARRGNDRP